MKTAIIYYSKHHENTKKLLEAIAEKYDVTLLDITENPVPDVSAYDCIGYASGIYYSKFHKLLLSFAENEMPDDRATFLSILMGQRKMDIQKQYPTL